RRAAAVRNRPAPARGRPAAVTTIWITSRPGEADVAAVGSDGTLLDYALWRPGAPDGVGDLHRGRVIAVVPAMAGAFVALDGADGFLPDSEGGVAAEGAVVGAGPPALLRRGPNAVERLAALHPDAPVIVDDPAIQALLAPALGK